MTPRKGQEVYHVRKHGERAERREKELTRPLESGNRAPFRICTHSGSILRRYANRVARHFVRNQLRNVGDFIDEAVDFFAGSSPIPVVTETPSEAELREVRQSSWMYHKVARGHCSVTVTAGRIIFH